jgi:HKD family nuclease
VGLEFIAQPEAAFRIGDFLKQSFSDPRWTEFRAAVAFVKRSGTKHIREPLEAFSRSGHVVKISAGVDAGGTSAEGLTDLLQAVDTRGDLFVFKNANSSTFHPKIYLFRNDKAAEIVVGSGNLTEGGLYTNYEASFLVRLDLAIAADAALLESVLKELDTWSTPVPGLCYALDNSLLQQLILGGDVPDEMKAWGEEKVAAEDQKTQEPSLFGRHSVSGAPKVPSAPRASSPAWPHEGTGEAEEDDEGLEVVIPSPVPGQGGAYKSFLMTLQKTDVGVGQTTRGTSRRSPEIFIPLVARDYDPEFWGWPNLFEKDSAWTGPKDRDGRGKMDRPGVMVRLGGATFPVHMWYNPGKKDLRLRSEHMRSAGTIGDILYVERSDGAGGFAYYVDVVPLGSPRHTELLAKCTNPVRNSKKVFGYI